MLNANTRSLLTDALTPPPAMHFDCGIATTFSLDPTALLTLPAHLAWLSAESDQELLDDPIRLLEALRCVADRLTIFCDHGRMLIPNRHHSLFGLMEGMIHGARAPMGGAFHSKVWLLRFVDEQNANPLLRLMVLSRNITFDNSWDLSLQLESRPGKSNVAVNKPLIKFLDVIARASVKPLTAQRKEMLATLRSECQKCTWELPADFTDINFHLIGTDTKPWLPPDSDELAIISPFVRDNALIKLLNTTDNAQLLLARDEELDGIKAETIGKFKLRKVLAEQAKTEDGEDANTRNSGLHAKAYILQKGWYTHLIMGSANAFRPRYGP